MYTREQIEKEIRKELDQIIKLAKKSDLRSYLNWYYPQIKECMFILVRFDIYNFDEVDEEFNKIDHDIKEVICKCLKENY